ncbi:MAG: metal-sensing transcriptional repressor [Candidatus Peribacteraceae bacterium]|jgi:DNA-binding FrmR family transcriptional regulator
MPKKTLARPCARLIGHLNRIQGQIDALKTYLEDGRPCEEVSHLTHSISTSFASARASIVEKMLRDEFPGTHLPRKSARLKSIVALAKS